MRKFVLLAVLVGLAFGMVALAAPKVTITFWHAMTRAHKDALTYLAGKFMETHPDIQINLVYQGHYRDLSQKLLAAVLAGKPPVMAQMYEDWTVKFIDAGALLLLEPYVSEDILADIPESLITSNTFEVDGKKVLVTLPFNKSAMVLFYNTDLIDKPPTTWDELLEMAKSLTVDKDGDGKIDQYGFGIRPYPELFIEFFHQAGGVIFNEDMTKCLINSEAGITAMNFLLELKKYSLYQSGYLSGPFGSGRVAMYIGSSAGIPFVASASAGHHGWNTAALPVGPANGESIIQGTNIGVFSLGTTEEQQRAAIEFAKFLISPEATRYWAIKTGYLPVRISVLSSPEWEEYIAQHPEHEAPTEMLLKGFVYPHHANMYNIRQVIGTAFEEVMLGKKSPQQALDDAAKTIETKYLKVQG